MNKISVLILIVLLSLSACCTCRHTPPDWGRTIDPGSFENVPNDNVPWPPSGSSFTPCGGAR